MASQSRCLALTQMAKFICDPLQEELDGVQWLLEQSPDEILVAPAHLTAVVLMELNPEGAEEGESRTKLAKLVFHEFVLDIVTGEQASVQPVATVMSCPATSVTCLLNCPGQRNVSVVESVPPL